MARTVKTSVLLASALVATLALVVASASAQETTAKPAPTSTQTPAQTPASTPPDKAAAPEKGSWEDLDQNHDGNVSKDESAASPGLHEVFDKADANADGILTGDEYRAYLAMRSDEHEQPMTQDKK